jgi:uncharacterized membrane protein
MATRRRHLAKALSYRLFGSGLACIIAWMISRDARVALGVLGVDGIAKVALYYLHERFWDRISWGSLRVQRGPERSNSTAPQPVST